VYPTSVQALPKANAHDTGAFTAASAHSSRQGLLKRTEVTGARWSLDGAEAVLKLRALEGNGDFDNYFGFHLRQQKQRDHDSRYQQSQPAAA